MSMRRKASGPDAQPNPGAARPFRLAASLSPVAGVGSRAGYERQDSTGMLRTVIPSPYNDRAHLTPEEYEDHDGGPWGTTPQVRPVFKPVREKWVVAPALGASAPALCVFPRRLSNNVSFSPEVHLSFAACWTPVVARFTELFLSDVDKKGFMPSINQVCTVTPILPCNLYKTRH